jgi:hypothetical protein
MADRSIWERAEQCVRSRRTCCLPVALRHRSPLLQPICSGWLSGRYRKGKEPEAPSSAARQRLTKHSTSRYGTTSASSTPLRNSPSSPRRTGITHIQLANRLRAQPPRHHVRDHRPANDGASREPTRRRSHRPRPCDPRPDQRDHRPRNHAQPQRQRLQQPVTGTGSTATVDLLSHGHTRRCWRQEHADHGTPRDTTRDDDHPRGAWWRQAFDYVELGAMTG